MSRIIWRDCPGSPSTARGFSLIELMVVLVVVTVLLSIAVPSYSVVVLRTKLKSYANSLVASAYLARSEAIKRNGPVRLCVVNSDGDDCQGGGSWEQGWIVIDPNETIIRSQQALKAGMVLFETGKPGEDTIIFQPSGIASTSAVMTLCQETPESPVAEVREISISATGRPRVETKTGGCSPP